MRSLENIGNKIENLGLSIKELSEILPRGKKTTNRTGFVLENIGTFIKKFVNINISCKDNTKPKNNNVNNQCNIVEKDEKIKELENQLKIANNKIKELENKLVNANGKIESFSNFIDKYW